MKSVKGQGMAGPRPGGQRARCAAGQTVGGQMLGAEPRQRARHEAVEDWAQESPESEQLRRALIEAGRAFMPRHDPARLERVFRRIVTQLEQEERKGIPVHRIESPSGVTAKIFG
jgi:hypothetical protein